MHKWDRILTLGYIFVALVILTMAARGQDKFNNPIVVGKSFSELEQIKLVNSYRKGQEGLKAYNDGNCHELFDNAKKSNTAYDDLRKSILKAHNLPEDTPVAIDLENDTANPEPHKK